MRPEILNPIFAEIEALKGVGPTLARPLAKLGISRVVDLLFHLPTGMVERRRVERLDMADAGRGVIVMLVAQSYKSSASPRGPFRVQASDAEGNHVSLVYFGGGGGWARKQLPLGEPRIVTGRLDLYGQELQIVHPDQVAPLEEAGEIVEREPVYPLSAGITSRRIAQMVVQSLDRVPPLPEWIEPSLLAHRGWPSFAEALIRAHQNPSDEIARTRLAYDEVYANQLALMLVRGATRRRKGRPLVGDGRLRDKLDLPYAPTGAQSRAIAEIEGDMAQMQPMLRLLQGDVGAGKTLVATMALLAAVEAGAQGALLAPTEILARQHLATLQRQLAPLGLNVAILTGREKGRVRESTLMGLADGSIDILIGTHAIFQEAVAYKALGLVVVDEQHRFGVAQRLMLAAKGSHPPHMLVMTATPIPRTLTLANYGEMDVSRLDEMPPGRQPIETRVIALERLDEVVAGLGRHVAAGGQAYWVCPLVEETDNDDSAAEARAASLKLAFGDRIGLVHGRMKGGDKDAVMAAFLVGQLSVLVATTVIEVGVDVPNATLIVIEGAERFGLAQLHQLRGRVGRGSQHSRCLLLRGNALSETSRSRLALMRESNDGFRIAEEDLRLRGGGELLGTRQSGEAGARLADAVQTAALIETAHADARLLTDRDGGLEGPRGQAALTLLYLFEREAAVALLRAG